MIADAPDACPTALALPHVAPSADTRHQAYVQWLTRLGDQSFLHLVESGDALTRAMYGDVSVAAGMVDGVLNMILARNKTHPCPDGAFLQAVTEMQAHVTSKILRGQYPCVRNSTTTMFGTDGFGAAVLPPRSAEGVPPGYRVMHVREARIVLQAWILHSIVDERDFANWLADNSKHRERFREWFELLRGTMDLHLRGCRSGPLNAHDSATTLALTRALNHELATYYVIMVEH